VEAYAKKPEAYQKVIADILPENLVYIDENGIEKITVKDRGWGTKKEKLSGKKSEHIISVQTL
jgi:hypothetical protein